MQIKQEDVETDDEGVKEVLAHELVRVKSEETDDDDEGSGNGKPEETESQRIPGAGERKVTNKWWKETEGSVEIPKSHTPTWSDILPKNFSRWREQYHTALRAASNIPSAESPRTVSHVRESYRETGIVDKLKIEPGVQFSNLRVFNVQYPGPNYGLVFIACNGRVVVKEHRHIPESNTTVNTKSVKAGDIIVAVNGYLIPYLSPFHKVLMLLRAMMRNPPVTVTFARDADFTSLFLEDFVPNLPRRLNGASGVALSRGASTSVIRPAGNHTAGVSESASSATRKRKAGSLGSDSNKNTAPDGTSTDMAAAVSLSTSRIDNGTTTITQEQFDSQRQHYESQLQAETKTKEALQEKVDNLKSLVVKQQKSFDSARASQKIVKERLDYELQQQQKSNNGLKRKIEEMEQREKERLEQMSQMASSHETEVAALRDELKSLRSLLE